MISKEIVCGPAFVTAEIPDDTQVVGPGVTLPLPQADDLAAVVRHALDEIRDPFAWMERTLDE